MGKCLQRFEHLYNKKHLKNVGPIRHCEPFYIAIHQVSLLSHAACASMSTTTTTTTTTTTRDRGDRYGPHRMGPTSERDRIRKRDGQTDKGRIAALLYAPLYVGRDIKFPCTHYFHLRGVLTAAVDGQRWPAAMRAVL